MPTDAQIKEIREAIAGEEAMLLPVMPAWFNALSLEERDELILLAWPSPPIPPGFFDD